MNATMSNGQLKPVHLVFATIAVVVTGAGAMWSMVAAHAAAPHSDAVHRNEIELLKNLMQSEHESLRREIGTLKEMIERIPK